MLKTIIGYRHISSNRTINAQPAPLLNSLKNHSTIKKIIGSDSRLIIYFPKFYKIIPNNHLFSQKLGNIPKLRYGFPIKYFIAQDQRQVSTVEQPFVMPLYRTRPSLPYCRRGILLFGRQESGCILAE